LRPDVNIPLHNFSHLPKKFSGSIMISTGGEGMADSVEKILNQSGITEFGFCAAESVIFRNPPKTPFDFTPASVIAAVFPYLAPSSGDENLCMYARVPDYHIVVGNRLKSACDALAAAFTENYFSSFVDSSVISEVAAALRCGLGLIGKNRLLITPKYGSYVFIGVILTDLKLDYNYSEKPVAFCPDCGRCVAACPTQTLSDKGDCLSRITQKKGDLTDEETNLIRKGGLAWGCDICQNVCPLNEHTAFTDLPEFQNGIKGRICAKDLDDLTGRAYGWRGREVLVRNLKILGQYDKIYP
jgi:epoxyqueuosine reductase